MTGSIIGSPIRWFFGIMIGVPLLIVLMQLSLVFFDYSVERLYLNNNLRHIMNAIEENGGLQSYSVGANIQPYSKPKVTATDNQAGTARSLDSVCSELEHQEPFLEGINGTGFKIENAANMDMEACKFFSRSRYAVDVDYNSVSYIGSEVKITLHRDIAFKMLWNIPWVIHLSEESSYVHDTQYTPSEGYGRDGGAAYIG